jgi:hypothetical protein
MRRKLLVLAVIALTTVAIGATSVESISAATSAEASAVHWAISQEGQANAPDGTSWALQCLPFVQDAYVDGTGPHIPIQSIANPTGGWNKNTDPEDVWSGTFSAGTRGLSPTTPPYGALVFFDANSGYDPEVYSHVEIMGLNGEMIGTPGKASQVVFPETLRHHEAAGDFNTYVGWWLPDGAPVPVHAPVGTLSVVAKGIGMPDGLAVDAHGDLFIAEVGTADSGNYVVELTPGGKLSVVAGDGQGESGLTPGPATRSSVDGAGMAVDSQGDLFIADYYRDVVLEVTPARNLSVVAGVFAKAGPPKRGPATSSTLDGPVAVAVDGHGNLFIADRGNYVVEKVTPADMLSVVAGIGRGGPTKPGPATSSGMWPIGVAVDASGNLFIADGENYVVGEVTPAGKLSVVAGVPGKNGLEVPGPATSSDLPGLTAIALDRQGNLFIAENRGVVDEVSRAGELSVVAGDGKLGLPKPGPATKSGLGGLNGVAVDAQGDLFIADFGPTPYGPYSVEKVTF